MRAEKAETPVSEEEQRVDKAKKQPKLRLAEIIALALAAVFIAAAAFLAVRRFTSGDLVFTPTSSTPKVVATEWVVNINTASAEELMMLLFWLEEEHPGMFHAFELQRLKQKAHHGMVQKSNHADDIGGQTDSNVYYRDGDSWPAHAPCGLWIDNPLLNGFMREWLYHQQELKENVITREEYFEWKIGWPYTCDECGKRKPAKQWRRSEG